MTIQYHANGGGRSNTKSPLHTIADTPLTTTKLIKNRTSPMWREERLDERSFTGLQVTR